MLKKAFIFLGILLLVISVHSFFAARSPENNNVTAFIIQNFSDPMISDKFLNTGREWMSDGDHYRINKAHESLSQSANGLKPEEIKALEALDKRDGAENKESPEFLIGKKYGDGYSVKYKELEFTVKPMTASSRSKAAIEHGALVYEKVEPNTDALYLSDRSGNFEKALVLYRKDSPKKFSYAINSGKDKKISVHRNAAGELEVASSAGTKLILSKPVIIDSENRRVSGEWLVGKDIQLCFNDKGLKYPILIDPTWRTVGNMTVAQRSSCTATLLPNGKVLIAGGYGGGGTVELYDPSTGTFVPAGGMQFNRRHHTATLLPNGKVLIAGGNNSSLAELYDPATGILSPTGSMTTGRQDHTATLLPNGKVLIVGGNYGLIAELYDPSAGANGTFTSTGSMSTTRLYHTATLLPNGKVLIAGGQNLYSVPQSSAEVYDPDFSTFATTGSMAAARTQHTATLLPDGKVLITGGYSGGAYLSSAEVYDPALGTFGATGDMAAARDQHTATLLPNGKVLIVGGYSGDALSSAEVYDPALGTFGSAGSIAAGRYAHAATLLPDGKVLVAGGAVSTVEVYDPSAGTFEATGSMANGRYQHTATLLPNGKMLVTGGRTPGSGGSSLSSAELYDPFADSFSSTGDLLTSRSYHTATLLPNGKVLIAGGENFYDDEYDTYILSSELYNPAAGTFESTGDMITARSYHTATLLPNGKVLIAGGSGGGSSAELYNLTTGTFASTGSMLTSRWFHTATLLPNGKVLIAGGSGGGSSSELYNPATGTFESTGSMTTARQFHTATLLPNGKVLIAGGTGGGSSSELYNPASGIFESTGSMSTARAYHTATLLPNGKVLVAGGTPSGSGLSSAELYDPSTGLFSSAGDMATARKFHTATLLPNSKVLVAGGENSGALLSSAELIRYTECDYTTYASTMQPSIEALNGSLSFPASIEPNTTYTLTGFRFKGTSESSGGNYSANSPTNYPRVNLQFMDSGNNAHPSGRLIDVTTTEYPIADWQNADTSISFTTPSDLPAGYYLLSVVANAVPSDAKIVAYPLMPPIPPTYGLSVTPASAKLFTAASNTTVETTYYHLVVSNEGEATDSFTLSAVNTPSSWTSAFYPENDDKGIPSAGPITTIEGLAAGATREVFVGITPSTESIIGSVNTTEVIITSVNDPSKTGISTLETAIGAWTMYRHDPRHTGRSPFKGPEHGAIKWSYATGGNLYSSPAIASDGTIYIGAMDDYNLYAINPDGSYKWSFTTAGPVFSSPAIGSDGTIYVGTTNGHLYMINPDGSSKWNSGTDWEISSSPVIGPDGVIYVTSDRLYAINPDGSRKWKATEGGYPEIQVIYSSPAIGPDGTIYYGTTDLHGEGYTDLIATNPDGSYKWSYHTNGQIYSSPAIASDGTIYIGALDDYNLYAIKPDGSLKWSCTTEGGVFSSPAIGSDGTIYVGSGDSKLYAINPDDGSVNWSYLTGAGFGWASPAIGSDGTLYVSSDKFYAISSDGSLKWSNAAGVGSTPAIGPDGTVYVGSYIDNALYAFAEDTTPPIVTIEAPAIGASLEGGTQYTISWEASDNGALSPEAFTLWYSTNEGIAWQQITTEVLGSFETTYLWNVPDIATNKAMISVEAADSAGFIGYGISGTFEIAGLVGHWSFEEDSGSTVIDSSGQGNDGTIYGATRVNSLPGLGKAMSFYGVGDYVEVPNSASLNFGTGPMTIALWAKGGFAGYPLLAKTIDTTGYAIQTDWHDADPSNYSGGYYWYPATAGNELIGPAAIVGDLTAWHHIVVTRSDGNGSIYIDGDLKTSGTFTMSSSDNTVPLKMGYDPNWGDYNGLIDEIRIYNRALSSDEVKAIYDALDTTTPVVTIESPAVGNVLSGGTQYTITWEASDNVMLSPEAFTLWFSSNEGTAWQQITTEVIGSFETTYLWNVPNVITNKAMISVEAIDISGLTGYGISGTFEIAGLVSYWKLDETSGTTAHDSVGTNNANFYNSPSWTTEGRVKGAIALDPNDYLQATGINSASGMSYELWVYLDSYSPGNYRMFIGNDYGAITYAGISDDGKIHAYIEGMVGETHDWTEFVSTNTVSIGTWHHVVVTANTSDVSFYIDNIRNANDVTGRGWTGFNTGSSTLQIGIWVSSYHQWAGKIDEVKVYNRALSSLEVSADYYSAPPMVTVKAPSTGNVLSGETQCAISWEVSSSLPLSPEAFTLWFSSNEGTAWQQITTEVLGSFETTYLWNVPNISTIGAMISVEAEDLAENIGYGISGTFEIISTIPPNSSYTPPGSNVTVEIGGATLVFLSVEAPGVTTIITTSEAPAPLPGTFGLLGTYYEISTTAEYSGTIEVTFTYDDTGLSTVQESGLKLQQYDSGNWVDITKSLDTAGNIITGEAPHLSYFAITKTTAGPIIDAIWVNGIRFRSRDIISTHVSLEARITSESGVNAVTFTVDGVPETINLVSGSSNEGMWLSNFNIPPSPSQLHVLTFRMEDSDANTREVSYNARVLKGSVQVVSPPHNYPNPFKPMSGGTTSIQYTLSTDATITIVIYDMTGHEVKRMKFSGGTSGGRGGINQVLWDGRSFGGKIVGNGMYFYKIISGNEVIGSGKLAIFD